MDKVGQRFSGTESKGFWKPVIALQSNMNVGHYTEIRMQLANDMWEKVMFHMKLFTVH